MAKSKFNKEKIITGLCIWLSEGKTLRSFCREDGTPAYTNIYQWMNDSEAFASRIAHARSIGYDSIAEECFEIADNTKMGTKVKESEDGIEVMKLIKKLRPELPVILLTGHMSPESSRDGIQAGATDYLLKPINLEDLIVKMEDAITANRRGEN